MVGRVFKTSFISSIDDSTFVQRYAARRVCFAWHFKLVFSLTFPALFKVGRRPPSPAVSREDCGNFVIWPCLISPLCWVVCYPLISLPKPQTQSPRLIHLPTRRHQAPGAEHRRLLRGAQRLEHPTVLRAAFDALREHLSKRATASWLWCGRPVNYRRWSIELFFRDVKTTMHMEVLRTKSPEMIEKERVAHARHRLQRDSCADPAKCGDTSAGVGPHQLQRRGGSAAAGASPE